MALPQAAASYYRSQQNLTIATMSATRRVWAQMGVDFDASWPRVMGKLRLIVSAGQLAAARDTTDYFAAVLAETDQIDRPVAVLRPASLTGVAADGRTLEGLLEGAVVNAKKATTTMLPAEALARGGQWLDMAVQSAIADAGRQASAVQLAVRPDIGGYTRVVNQPACARCTVLAGKFFEWNRGFLRHPRCDCRHIPASRDSAPDLLTAPASDERVAGVSTTTAGTSTGRRVMPEHIIERAPSRNAAVRLLRDYGYAA